MYVSIESSGGWDVRALDVSGNNHFSSTHIDADGEKSNFWNGMSFFRGKVITRVPSTSERRQIVVINGLAGATRSSDGSPIAQWEILHNEAPPGGSLNNAEEILAAINAVTPGPVLLSYSAWEAQQLFPPGGEGAQSDPDRDGASNLQEFFGGTDPQDPGEVDVPFLRLVEGGVEFVYWRAKGLAGVTARVEMTGSLQELWAGVEPELGAVQVTDLGGREEVAIGLGPTAGRNYFRLRVSLE